MRIENYDYSYELTDEQLRHYSALPAIAKLRWLDQARRFTLLARKGTTAVKDHQQSATSNEMRLPEESKPGG